MIPQKFIIAVSGGVDSVVLLHMLMAKKPDTITYIVAHFDHGIRDDSHDDAAFVAQLASNSHLTFELGEGSLGSEASEDLARVARYKYLRSIKDKYQAEKIITAHHQDDFLETIVLNLLRGTGPRGLNPMQGQNDILRPLMNKNKLDILSYAKEHKLDWREDPTNTDDKYLRNYVRKNVMPKLASERQTLLETARKMDDVYADVDQRIQHMLPSKNILSRVRFVQYSYCVQREIMRAWLLRQLIERLTVACKTLPMSKKIDVNGVLWLVSEKENLLLVSK